MSGLDESRDTDTAATGDAVTPLVIQATPPAPPRFSPRTRDFLAWVALPPARMPKRWTRGERAGPGLPSGRMRSKSV